MEKIKGKYTLEQAYDLVNFATNMPPIETIIFDGNNMDDTLELSNHPLIKPFIEPGFVGSRTVIVLNDNMEDFPTLCIIYPEIEESEDKRFDLCFEKKIEMESFDKLIDELDGYRSVYEVDYDSIRIIPTNELSSEELDNSTLLNSYSNGFEEFSLCEIKLDKEIQFGQVVLK